jgi:hypothetical protein
MLSGAVMLPPAQPQIHKSFCAAFFKKRLLPCLQNKKYLCAIGSISAGSQIRSWPSARTS